MEHRDGNMLRVQRVEIVDSQGRPRITLGITGDLEDPNIELFDATGKSRLSMAIDSDASANGGLVYLTFDGQDDMPRLVLELLDNEVSIKELDPKTAGEVRRVRWQRVPDREEIRA